MSTSTSPQDQVKRNWQAIASVSLGVVAMFLALIGKGTIVLLIVGLLASLGGIATGALGFRAAQQLNKRGRNWAIAGIIIGAIGALVTLVLIVQTLRG